MPLTLPDGALEPSVAAAVARAERRREMLERLSDLGIQLAQDIAERAGQAPRGTADAPEPRHDPGRAFAAVSRAVRLTLALEAKIDEQVLALLRGDASGAAASPPEPSGSLTWPPLPPADAFARRRGRISACLWDAIDEGLSDRDAADDLCAAVHERLVEGETYDELLFRPFRESVEAICRDLGLKPDWSRWDDDVGFPPETRRTDHKWSDLWNRWPSGAQLHRQNRLGLRYPAPHPRE